MILSATLIPSIPADVIPPAWPAPSPQGNNPLCESDISVTLSRFIVTGAEVRVSGARSTPPTVEKPLIWRSKTSNAFLSWEETSTGSNSDKLKSKSISIVENIDFKAPKTKDFDKLIKAFGLEGKKTLFIMDGVNKNVYLSARNLEKSEVVTDSEISTFSIVNAQHLIIEENAVEKIQSKLI